MDDSFHFALLRVSVAQILKASGFDKCKPSVLNVVTDLYVQYFKLLVHKTMKYSVARTHANDSVHIQDIVQAMLDVQLIKPSSFETALDPHDSLRPKLAPSNASRPANYNTKSVESFVEWLHYSDSFRTSKKLAEVPKGLIKNLIDKRKTNDPSETDQDRKRRRLKEKQDFYNNFKEDENHHGLHSDDDNDAELDRDSLLWDMYLAEKDLKLGHHLKFLNSSLEQGMLLVAGNRKLHPVKDQKELDDIQLHIRNANKHDHVVLSVEEENSEDHFKPSDELVLVLPYNVQYGDLLEDDLELYWDFHMKNGDAEVEGGAHQDEIEGNELGSGKEHGNTEEEQEDENEKMQNEGTDQGNDANSLSTGNGEKTGENGAGEDPALAVDDNGIGGDNSLVL